MLTISALAFGSCNTAELCIINCEAEFERSDR